MRRVVVVVLCVVCGTSLLGNDIKTEVAPVPIIGYSPDTSLMLGAMGMMLFSPVDDPDAPKDQLLAMGMYTLNHQYQVALQYKKNFYEGRLVNEGEMGYSVFPTDYYGIGADSLEDNHEMYTAENIGVEEKLYYNFAGDFSVGGSYDFSYEKVKETEEGGLMETDTPIGGDRAVISAPGILFIYDARDNEFYPAHGNYFFAQAKLNNTGMGATRNSSRVELDYRHFVDLHENEYVLGFHGVGIYQGGDVPLSMLEGVGAPDIMRGYASSRYVDKCKYALQSEFRYPLPFTQGSDILSRFRGALFAGVANVAPELSSFESDTTRWAAGLGLRYAVMKEEKINIRLDLTINKDNETNMYLDFMESF